MRFMKYYAAPTVFYLSIVALMFWLGYVNGEIAGRRERANECSCGWTQSCPFGPGIVGEQRCQSSLDKNEWGRCEPKEEKK